MSYLDPLRPPAGLRTTDAHVEWAAQGGLLMPVAGLLTERCEHCYGSVGLGYEQCSNCQRYADYEGWDVRYFVDYVVPVTYSSDDGFESLLHQFKNFESTTTGTRQRLGAVIASLLYEFLTHHLDCLCAGKAFDFATLVPPRQKRAYTPMRLALDQLRGGWPVPWVHDLVVNAGGRRPGRGIVLPNLYELDPHRDIDDASILLVDDTWTSGSTMVSVARRLKQAGAARVVGLPLGRQVKDEAFGSSHDLYREAHARQWSLDRCVLCA